MTERDMLLELLESILPYVEFAAKHKQPNASSYVKIIKKLLWS